MHYDPPLTQLPSGSARLICVSPPTQFAYHDGGLITTAASTRLPLMGCGHSSLLLQMLQDIICFFCCINSLS